MVSNVGSIFNTPFPISCCKSLMLAAALFVFNLQATGLVSDVSYGSRLFSFNFYISMHEYAWFFPLLRNIETYLYAVGVDSCWNALNLVVSFLCTCIIDELFCLNMTGHLWSHICQNSRRTTHSWMWLLNLFVVNTHIWRHFTVSCLFHSLAHVCM